jgi:hypothetical protein
MFIILKHRVIIRKFEYFINIWRTDDLMSTYNLQYG